MRRMSFLNNFVLSWSTFVIHYERFLLVLSFYLLNYNWLVLYLPISFSVEIPADSEGLYTILVNFDYQQQHHPLSHPAISFASSWTQSDPLSLWFLPLHHRHLNSSYLIPLFAAPNHSSSSKSSKVHSINIIYTYRFGASVFLFSLAIASFLPPSSLFVCDFYTTRTAPILLGVTTRGSTATSLYKTDNKD